MNLTHRPPVGPTQPGGDIEATLVRAELLAWALRAGGSPVRGRAAAAELADSLVDTLRSHVAEVAAAFWPTGGGPPLTPAPGAGPEVNAAIREVALMHRDREDRPGGPSPALARWADSASAPPRDVAAGIAIGNVGAVLILGPAAVAETIAAIAGDIAPLVEHQTAGRRPLGRLWHSVTSRSRLATIAAILALAAAMRLPMDHLIASHAVVVPRSVHHVVAPYEGQVDVATVRPGDRVVAGQTLVSMRDVPLRIRRAEVVARGDRLDDQLRIHRAADDHGKLRVATAERKAVEAELRLIDHQLRHSHLTTPIDGVVIEGDGQTLRGAAVGMGQALLRVADLQTLRIELTIPADLRRSIDVGSDVRIRIDAADSPVRRATIDRINPRTEIRDGENVFVAIVDVDNADGGLHPGMIGDAKLVGPRRSLGWIISHRAARTIGRWWW